MCKFRHESFRTRASFLQLVQHHKDSIQKSLKEDSELFVYL